jgi:hypothetical protein
MTGPPPSSKPHKYTETDKLNPGKGQQIQVRVEQLPIKLVARQATPSALTQDTQYRRLFKTPSCGVSELFDIGLITARRVD